MIRCAIAALVITSAAFASAEAQNPSSDDLTRRAIERRALEVVN